MKKESDVKNLQDQLKRMQKVCRVLGVGDMELKVDTGDLNVSDLAVDMFGLNVMDAPYTIEDLKDAIYVEDRIQFEIWMAEQIEVNNHVGGIFRVIHKDGFKYVNIKATYSDGRENSDVLLITAQDITNNYAIKKAMDEEVLRSKMGARAAKLAFFRYEFETEVQTVDDYWYELAGLEIHYENVQPYFKENIYQDDLVLVEEFFKLDKEKLEKSCEFRLYNRYYNNYIWIRMTGMIIEKMNEPDKYIFLGVYQNIDDQVKSQNEIRNLAKMLDIGMKNGRVDIWDYNMLTNKITLRCNNQETYGVDSSIITFHLDAMKNNVHHEDLKYLESNIRRIWISKEPSFSINFRYVNPKSFDTHWLKLVGRVTEYDELGRASRCIGIAQNITDRYQNEERLRKNEEKLRQASHIAHLGSWEYSASTQMVELLEGVHEILGMGKYNEHYLVSKRDFINFAVEDDRDKLEAIFDATHNWLQFDERFFANINGQPKKLHIIATYKYDKYGNLLNIIGTIQDITEINALEQALRQAEKMTAIGQLAGGIAHDFNNILMATSGYTELIMLKSNQDEVKMYCNKVMDSIRRSTDLTRKLLAFSRKDSLIKKPMELHQTLDSAAAIISRTIDKSIEVITELDAQEDLIFGDASEIQNVFMNLCLNARDAMPDGGVLRVKTDIIHIQYENHIINGLELSEGDYIRTTVEDTGYGIDEKHIEKIFDPFFTTKEVGKGTGLGLSASFGTIVSHRGAIDVESALNEGTKFYVYFPLYRYN